MTCPFVQPNIYKHTWNPFTVAWLPTRCNSTPLMIFLFFMDIHFRWFQEGRRMDRGIQDAACAAQWWETLETSGERDTAKLSTDTTTSWGKSWRGSEGGQTGQEGGVDESCIRRIKGWRRHSTPRWRLRRGDKGRRTWGDEGAKEDGVKSSRQDFITRRLRR